MKLLLVQTTCGTKKEAKKISKVLIEEGLAACIQISKVKSFYIWENEFCNDKEILLSIKTKKENFKKIKSKIKELHSYHVPEIVAIPIEYTSKEYKNFIKENTK